MVLPGELSRPLRREILRPDGARPMSGAADAALVGVVQEAFAQGATVNATLFVDRPQGFAIDVVAPRTGSGAASESEQTKAPAPVPVALSPA